MFIPRIKKWNNCFPDWIPYWTNSEKYVLEKEDKIEELRKKQSMPLKPEEKLWLNKMLYDEYFVYNADSGYGLCKQ